MSSQFSFKQTKTDRMPEDWEMVRLVNHVDVYSGYAFKRQDFLTDKSKGIPIIKIGNLQNGTVIIDDNTSYVAKDFYEKFPDFKLHSGDVLIALSGATTGKIAVANKNLGLVLVNQRVGKFKIVDSKKIIQQFFYYFAQSENFRRFIFRNIGQSAQGNLSPSQILNSEFLIPPLPEQKKIAEILSIVDRAIQKVDEAIEKTKRLKKGLMQELLTKGIGHKELRETEIGRIPKEWEVVKLGEIANVRYGLGQPPALETNGIPMIRATNVKRGKIVREGLIFLSPGAVPKSRDPFLRVGDILVVRSGAYTGDVALVTKEWDGAVAGYDLIVTPLDTINSQFLAYYLLSSSVQKRYFFGLKVRSAQPHLNSSQVEETPIPLPSLSEQRQIARILGVVDRRIELLGNRKQRLGRIKKGLMNDLLTGRKRVRLEA